MRTTFNQVYITNKIQGGYKMLKKSRVFLFLLSAFFVMTIIFTGCGASKEQSSAAKSQPAASSEVKKDSAPASQPAADTKVKVLRYSHPTSTKDDIHVAAEFFAKRIKELTNGSLEIKIYPANELGAPQEVAEQVRLGTIDMCNASGGQLQLWTPQFAAIQLPFQFLTVQQAYKVLDNEGGEMLAKLAREKGFEVLGHWELGFRIISNNVRPINSVADLKGLKLRVPPEVPQESCMKAVGVIPASISWSETYMALSQKVVDGQENPIRYIYINGIHKVQKYMAVPGVGYMYQSYPHVMSSKTFNSLTKEQQDAIRKASNEARDFMRKNVSDTEKKAIQEMKQMGIVITNPDPEPFRKAMEPAYKVIADYATQDFVKEWAKIVEKYK